MNPSSSEVNGLKLPAPMPEQAPKTPQTPEVGQALPEAAPIAAPEAAAQPAVPVLPSVPLPAVDDTAAAPVPPAATTDAPAIADDSDLIEKEWVDKAKQIIEKNRDDPYQQSKEITIVKADYLKKRYNKTIKLSE